MRQLAVISLSLALGVATAIGLASCGSGDDAELLPGSTAAEISENLDAVKQLASEGECIGAAEAADQVRAQVEALDGVDPKLKQALEKGSARLAEVVATCEEASTETLPPPTEDTEEEAKAPPGQEKKEEKERDKEEAETEKNLPPDTPTTPAETSPAEPPTEPPPSEGGGTGAPGGVSPAEPAPEAE
jgi:hypothetical protein